jgi:tetratricopeptide (TPR) repeat protein
MHVDGTSKVMNDCMMHEHYTKPHQQRHILRLTNARVTTAVLISCVFMVLLSRTAFASGAPSALIVAEAGSVSIEQAGSTQFVPAAIHDSLYTGNIVATGADGEAAILFTDGAQVKLNRNSSIRISPEAGALKPQSLFQAMIGVIWAHLRPGQVINAPTANIVVRGTEVTIDVAGDGTTQLTVVAGDVEFRNGLGSVELTNGQQSTAAPGEGPSAPIAVDATGLIAWTGDIIGLPLDYETAEEEALPQSSTALAQLDQSLINQTANNPVDGVAWEKLGDVQRALGEAGAASTSYANALRIDPSNSSAGTGLALTYLSQGRTDLAETVLRPNIHQAPSLSVAGLIALESDQVHTAELDLKQSLAQDPSLYMARSLLALAYLSHDDLPDALSSAELAEKNATNSAMAAGVLSTVLFFDDHSQSASYYANKALKLNDRSPLSLLVCGRECMLEKNYPAAVVLLERASANDPRLWLVQTELGECYQRLGMPLKALEDYQNAISLNSNSANAHTGCGSAEQSLGQYDAARQEYQTATSIDPRDVAARYYYASYLIDRGNLNGALAQIDAVRKHTMRFGLLYSRLAEIYLYKQDLHDAEVVAIAGTKALPQSAIARYELGRVEYEEQHTYQAEQEFRIATVLDPNLEPARYALGLVQEKTQTGLLRSFPTIFDSAYIGSPVSSGQINDEDTPGANERLQAEVMDPTAIRSATQSYGDAEIDLLSGGRQSDDDAISYMTDTSHSSGVVAINADHDYDHGAQGNDDTTQNKASVAVGQKANDDVSYIVMGDYEQYNDGDNITSIPNPYESDTRSDDQLLRFTSGLNFNLGSSGRLSALVQGVQDILGARSLLPPNSSNYAINHIDNESLDGELRWDDMSKGANRFTAGLSYGERRRSEISIFNAGSPENVLDAGNTSQSPFQAYLRDDLRSGRKWSCVAQVQFIKEVPNEYQQPITQFQIPASLSETNKSFILPYFVASFASDTSTVLRLRYRKLGATITDFELLNPVDDFLITYAALPQSTTEEQGDIAEGTSTEAEIDKTFENASFLTVGVFHQHLAQSNIVDSQDPTAPYASQTNEGVQGTYQGSITNSLTYFVLGQYEEVRNNETNLRIAEIPRFEGICTLQYLLRNGLYDQVSYYDQTNYLTDTGSSPVAPGFGLLNLRTGKRFGLRTNIFVELNNALNANYVVYDYLETGRELRVGVSNRF